MARKDPPTPAVILITGASSGLGAALAEAYAAPGTTLLLCGRDETRLHLVAATCRGQGAEVKTACMDVTDKQAMAAWITARDEETPIDLVIANAGISAGTGGKDEPQEQVEHLFDVNVLGVLNTVYPVIPAMEKRGRGHIALMASLASFRGLPGAPAYSSSKAAVRVYGEALRGYLQKKQIAVTVICPGYIKTPMTAVNQFPMPLLMSAEKAAHYIRRRLQKRPSRLAFPFPMYALVWLMMCLPPFLTDPLFARLPEKPGG